MEISVISNAYQGPIHKTALRLAQKPASETFPVTCKWTVMIIAQSMLLLPDFPSSGFHILTPYSRSFNIDLKCEYVLFFSPVNIQYTLQQYY